MSDEELPLAERVRRWLVDREVFREVPAEELHTAIGDALDIGDLEASAAVGRSDQKSAERRDLLLRAAEIRRELGQSR